MAEPKQARAAVSGDSMAKEQLRQRILAIVDQKGSLRDFGIWQESGPDYLPWKKMLEEIRSLDREKKLRLEIRGPGDWIIHSVNVPRAGKRSEHVRGKGTATKSARRRKAA